MGVGVWVTAAPCSQDALDQQSVKLSKLDRGSVVDVEFVRCLATSAGEKKIQGDALLEFPDAEKAMTMTQSLAGLRSLRESVLYKFCSQGCQERLCCAERWVASMREGTQPTLLAGAHAWLQQVWARLPYYARMEVEQTVTVVKEENKKSQMEKVWVFGAEALKTHWSLVSKKKASDVCLEELDLLVALRHLLPHEIQEGVDKKQLEILKLRKPGLRKCTTARPAQLEGERGGSDKRRKVAASKAIAQSSADSLFA